MAIVTEGPVLPDDLVTYVRVVPQPANFILDQMFPNVYILNNRVDVGQITRTNRTARFRSFDADPHVNRRDTAQVSTVQLPALSDSLSMGELERLRIEQMRFQGQNQAAFVDAVYDDATTLTHNVQNRMELARGDLATDGKFTMLNANGEPQLETDWGVPAGNFVTPGVLWNHLTSGQLDADPLGDIFTWVNYYILLNGFAPGGMWINRTQLSWLLGNINIRTAAGTILGSSLMVTRPILDQQLEQRGLPPIVGIYDANVDVDGTTTRVIPLNKVIFVPPEGQPFGRTVWGVSVTAMELADMADVGLSFEQAAGIVGIIDKADSVPYRQTVYVDSVGMPVLDIPRHLMVATVA